MKRVALLALLLISINIVRSQAGDPMPCAAPPFVSNVVKPNILIQLDMTGSMWWRASRAASGYVYDSLKTYYGYFNETAKYSYSAMKFRKDANGRFPGNVMNFACMSRIDVARKVLSGGAGQPTNSIDKNTLQSRCRGPYSEAQAFYPCSLRYWSAGQLYRYQFNKPSNSTIRITKLHVHAGTDTVPTGSFSTDIDVSTDTIFKGVIRQIGDKDGDTNWDKDSPRFGLQFFSTGIGTPIVREFYMSDEDPDMEPYINTINNTDPDGGTWVGDAVLDAVHYLRYCQPVFGGYTHHGPRTKWDPYFWGTGGGIQQVECIKSFVVCIGDGESNSDNYQDLGHLPPGPFTPARPLYDYDNADNFYDRCQGGGDTDHPADDYAYYAHITDLRPDLDPQLAYRLPDKQNVTFFSIYAFGTGGSALFSEIAKDGGFNDKNNDNIPQVNEYDENSDGIPDNYYEAQSGQQMEDAIRKIIMQIMARVSSGSAAAVVSSGSRSEGAVHQSLFWPVKFEGTNQTGWIGLINCLWVDRYGYIREDTDHDIKLDLIHDYIVKMDTAAATAIRYRDPTGQGIDSLLVRIDATHIDNLNYVWDGGKMLASRSPDTRIIKTWIDKDGDKVVDAGELIDFSLANEADIWPYLGVPNLDTGRVVIRWVRGEDVSPYRTRQLSGQTWKLGDIISSTNTFTGKPMEAYSLLYYDASYRVFYNHYRYATPPPTSGRNDVVYVGANDGMLHAFNAGKFVETRDSLQTSGYLHGWGELLGKELWTYIPFNLLPHLKWMLDKKYCHVYYVDLKPYVTDVKIFTANAVHDSGWGTILIGGMRLGGTPITLGTTTYRSAYFAFDVTEPQNPQLLWEFTDSSLGFTTCYPTAAKVRDRWFLIFGSGPKNSAGAAAAATAKLYVLDLKTGALLRRFNLPAGDSICGDITAVDFGLNYSTDRIYFGTYNSGYNTGKLWRLSTIGGGGQEDPDPNVWTLSYLIDVRHPIIAGPAITVDPSNYLWVYFGTGRLYSDPDEADKTLQTFIGVKDEGLVVDTNELYNVTNVRVYGDSFTQGGPRYSYDTLIARIAATKGWRRSLTGSGERCLSKALVIGGAVIFTTMIPPDSICSYGGKGNLYALYYLTGSAYRKPILGVVAGEHIPSVAISGMPTAPGLYIGSDRQKAFIQSATGGIRGINMRLPFSPREGIQVWKGR